MPPPDRPNPNDPFEWLRRARSHLALAKEGRTLPEILFEDLCFHAQQAAEKAIKSLFVHRKLRFPYTHDIMVLLTILRQEGVLFPEDFQRAAKLTYYAVATRYPGDADRPTEEDYLQAIELAEAICHWAESLIRTERKES